MALLYHNYHVVVNNPQGEKKALRRRPRRD